MGQGRVKRGRLCAWLLVAALLAGCATLEAQQKRLASDPLFGGGAKKNGAATATATPVPRATAAAASAKATPGPVEKARAAVDAISDEDERALGEAVALRIIASTLAKTVPTANGGTRPSTGLELRDEALLAYVSDVGNLVALQGQRQAFPPATKPRTKARRFTFGVLDTADAGAYSVPGGYIFVTRGLLSKLTSESELAWVLGHEIAHVDWEDGLTALKADIGTKAFVGAFASAFNTQQGASRSQPADPLKEQAAFNAVADRFYDLYEGTGLARETEQRADEKGLEYSTSAGYDGQGAVRALDALAPPENAPGTIQLGRSFGDSINRFLTHGSKRERMAEMAAHLQKPGRTGAARYDRIALARIEQLASKGTR